MKSLSVGQRILAIFASFTVIALMAAALNMFITIDVGNRGLEAAEKLAPLGDAAMEIKLSATRAHLKFEEIMGGDAGESIDEVWALLDESRFYVDAILNGAANDEGTFFASSDPEVQAKIKEVSSEIEAFIAVAHERYDNRDANSGAGTAADQRFDEAFETFIAGADAAEEIIHDQMDAGVAEVKAGQAMAVWLVGIGGLVFVAATILAYFYVNGRIARRVGQLAEATDRMADGDYSSALPDWDGQDELGRMKASLATFSKALAERQRLQQRSDEQAEHDAERAREADRLNTEIAEVLAAAADGIFNRRISGTYSQDDLTRLGNSVNALVTSVDRGLTETGDVLSALAHANLDRRVTGDYRGAFDKLKTDANAVADKLVEIVGQLRQTSRGLKTATGEILSGANDLSERTTKQAATIEETSAAMEQLAHTVMANAKKAEEASDKSRAVSETAEEGGEVMTQANGAMEQITHSSAKISNIIGMIDDIAFQTNLLALNASVEAARAGEAGKGFAVVAVEVRRLAQSAAEASSEVKVLIEQSADEVANGTKLVASAAEKLSAMLEAVKENSTLMQGIAHDSREQASAIDEVNTAVRQMDEMTQHNAALVEETNAAIEQTEAQASELDRIVDVFTLSDAGQPMSLSPAGKPSSGIKAVTAKVASAAKTYLSKGNAAVQAEQDWSEF